MVDVTNGIKQIFSVAVTMFTFMAYFIFVYVYYSYIALHNEYNEIVRGTRKAFMKPSPEGNLCKEWKKSVSKFIDKISLKNVHLEYYKNWGFLFFTLLYFTVISINIYLSVVYDEEGNEKENTKVRRGVAITAIVVIILLCIMILNFEVGFELLLEKGVTIKTKNYTKNKIITEREKFINQYARWPGKGPNPCGAAVSKVIGNIFDKELAKEKRGNVEGIFEKESFSDSKYWGRVFWWGGFFIVVSMIFGSLIIWTEE